MSRQPPTYGQDTSDEEESRYEEDSADEGGEFYSANEQASRYQESTGGQAAPPLQQLRLSSEEESGDEDDPEYEGGAGGQGGQYSSQGVQYPGQGEARSNQGTTGAGGAPSYLVSSEEEDARGAAPSYQATSGLGRASGYVVSSESEGVGGAAPRAQGGPEESDISPAEEDPGYDNEYGKISKFRAQTGDPVFYANERRYHNDEYHDDYIRQQADYIAMQPDIPNYTTEAMRQQYPGMYAQEGDDPSIHRQNDSDRSCQWGSDEKARQGRPERERAAQETYAASRNLGDENINTTDWSYPEDNYLRHSYAQVNHPDRDEDRLNTNEVDRRRARREADDDEYEGGGED
ncbi:hypothetical protein H2200_001304 [Cladophialophora chaetospira]|uniref:Uncharacterized protein n=1 Tax=Cladophialophora chaetospira TaxID=386627 RepID=A0AA38XLE7_9EURO|nr:hypothetical protein H2200_001304 [Cladophialophora chaetospira]